MKEMNLPNKLTLLRIVMVPLVVLVYMLIDENTMVLNQANGFALRDLLAFLLFAIASITDMLDGQIARRNNLITSFGKFADPIADKLLVNTLLILMAVYGQVSVVAVLLMSARDLIVDGLRMLAAQHAKVVSAGIYGKMKTVLQMVAICLVLLKNWPGYYIGIPLDQIMIWLATAMSLFSGYVYWNQLKKYVLESM